MKSGAVGYTLTSTYTHHSQTLLKLMMDMKGNMATKADLKQVQGNMATKADLGMIHESLMRPTVARAKGEGYAMGFLARSVQDLVGLLPEDAILRGPEDTQVRLDAAGLSPSCSPTCAAGACVLECLN